MELYLAIFLFATAATITPGPNNIMILTSGLNFGIKRSIPHLMGVCFGFPAMVVLVGLGFGVVFERYPIFHQAIKILGVLYLLYLSWCIARSAPTSLSSDNIKPFTFFKAALFQWINPKAWVMATGAVAAYTTNTSDIVLQVLFIAFAFLAVAFPCVSMWLIFGVTLKKVLKKPSSQRLFNWAMALLLVASVIPVINEIFIEYF